MKKVEPVFLMVLIVAGMTAAPFTKADSVGHGFSDPDNLQPPNDPVIEEDASNFWQDLLDWVMPEEGEVEQGER
ncbi:MAG TPA: hypothetical protein VF267_00445 [Gammaproteobacteria bacterium]